MNTKSLALKLVGMEPRADATSFQAIRLPDGALVTIRSIRPSDARPLRRAFADLTPETRYLRFHAHLRELPARHWRYLTQVDGRDHVALVARSGPRMVGVARFIRLDEPALAEVAFVIADDFQRRGLGLALRDSLVVEARRRGVRTFRAHVLPENVGIRRLLGATPLRLRAREPEPGVLLADLPST